MLLVRLQMRKDDVQRPKNIASCITETFLHTESRNMSPLINLMVLGVER
jgi:hypothetical protein